MHWKMYKCGKNNRGKKGFCAGQWERSFLISWWGFCASNPAGTAAHPHPLGCRRERKKHITAMHFHSPSRQAWVKIDPSSHFLQRSCIPFFFFFLSQRHLATYGRCGCVWNKKSAVFAGIDPDEPTSIVKDSEKITPNWSNVRWISLSAADAAAHRRKGEWWLQKKEKRKKKKNWRLPRQPAH